MGHAVIFHLGNDTGLLRACQHSDGGRLLRLFVLGGFLGVVHIDTVRVGDRQHLDKAQLRHLFRSLQEVIDADDVVGLQLIRQAGGKRFYSQRDSDLAGGDIVERHI